nr:MAG TPA: hypothetical protein [Bacteriophage sp.]
MTPLIKTQKYQRFLNSTIPKNLLMEYLLLKKV